MDKRSGTSAPPQGPQELPDGGGPRWAAGRGLEAGGLVHVLVRVSCPLRRLTGGGGAFDYKPLKYVIVPFHSFLEAFTATSL